MPTERRGRLKPKSITGSGMLPVNQADDPAAQPDGTLPGSSRTNHLQVAPDAPEAALAAQDPGEAPAPESQAPGLPAVRGTEFPDLPEDSDQAAVTVPQAADARRYPVTVMVSVGVRDRFDEYRDAHKLSNTAVVVEALNAGYGRYSELVEARRPQAEPGALFGDAVPGRRLTTESKRSVQLSIYLTLREINLLKKIVAEAGTNQSELVHAVLDEFLPRIDPQRGSGTSPRSSRTSHASAGAGTAAG